MNLNHTRNCMLIVPQYWTMNLMVPCLKNNGHPTAEHRCGGKFLMGMESDCQCNPFFNIKTSFCECQSTKLVCN